MLRLTDFLAAFYPDENEPIHLRAFRAKGAPETQHTYPLVEAVTRRRLVNDAELQNRITAANKTRGWYFVVNSGGNADADITRFNAFFVENDSLPIDEQHEHLDAAPLKPSIRLETRKSVHAYWLIDGSCDADTWREVQGRLIAHFDGDKSIKNPSRVMRLPFLSYVHYDERAGEYEYRRIDLHTFKTEKRFNIAEMREAFTQVATMATNTSVSKFSAQAVKFVPIILEAIPIGSRHKELLSLAGSMRRRGMTSAEMFGALKVTNKFRCQPPLDETEILELCKDVEKRYCPETLAMSEIPLNKQGNSKLKAASEFSFTPLEELLAEPEEEISFVWDKTLPIGGFSICSAKPKVGKSTLARNLALAVSRGEPFLGRETIKGKVLYLCLEEKRSEVAKHFRRMNASADEIFVAFGTPEGVLAGLQLAIADQEPLLTIIDPLSRIVRVRDFNDYGAMSRALEPLIDLARKTSSHILTLHHDGKGEREGGDALLGSTALFGAVDCHIQMKKRERGRTILSTQRYGEDMPEQVIELNAGTGLVTARGDLQAVILADKKAELLHAINDTEELTEADLKERVGGTQGGISKAIRALVENAQLIRSGEGKKGNPYTYRKYLPNPENLPKSIPIASDEGQKVGFPGL